MSRILIALSLLLLIAFGVFLTRSVPEAYRLLPVDLERPPEPGPFDSWRKYTAQDGSFTAQFPVLPQHATDSVLDEKTGQKRHYAMYVANKNDMTTFVVTRITFPVGMEHIDLAAFRDEVLASKANSRLMAESQEEYQGQKTLAFTMDNDVAITVSKAFFVGDDLYLLMVIGAKDHFPQQDADHFFSQFRLTASHGQ